MRGDAELLSRESLGTVVAGMSMEHVLERLIEGGILVTPGDRSDVVVGTILAQRSETFPTLAGIICSDRAKAYNGVPILRRQICWAHLKRNWEKLQKRGGKAKVIAEAFLGVHKQVFELWRVSRRRLHA